VSEIVVNIKARARTYITTVILPPFIIPLIALLLLLLWIASTFLATNEATTTEND